MPWHPWAIEVSWLIDRSEWSRLYSLVQQIVPGLTYSRDQEATDLLSSILQGHPHAISFEELSMKVGGFDLGVVVGCGGRVLQDLYNLKARGVLDSAIVVAANGATRLLLDLNISPHIVVTDLDGDVEAVLAASRRAVLVVHAHGDNIEAIVKHVTRLRGPVIGSTQVEPRPLVYNFGGFTDGDRALFILYHLGVRKAYLAGFDFESPNTCPGKRLFNYDVKRQKLKVAELMIDYLRGKGMSIKHAGELA
jgi:uncharacterized Rossmann fold enzyme